MKKILSAAVIFLFPPLAQAHEQWFMNDAPLPAIKPELFTTWSFITVSFIVAAIAAVACSWILHRALMHKNPTKAARDFFTRYGAEVAGIMRASLGLALVVAAVQGFLFAPDLPATTTGAGKDFFIFLELIIGLGLVLDIVSSLMALLASVFFIMMLFLFPVGSVAAYVFFFGISLFLFLTKKSQIFPLQKYTSYAYTIMRILLGFSFMYGGVYYKILQPQYALTFLQSHHVNFMQMLGISSFSDELFVLAAGVTEIMFGLLITLCILPRLTAACVFVFMLVPIAIFGIQDLFGHLPIFAGLFAIMVYGCERSTKSASI